MAQMRVAGKGDGVANDTAALQEAVRQAHREGGGRVVLPSGKVYRSGTFSLLSGVELHLEPGARLLASPDPRDFQRTFETSGWDAELHAMAMIVAQDVENVAITGLGTIDGNGRAYVEQDRETIYRMRPQRPFTTFLIGANGVTLRDVRIVDGASWTVRLTGCEDVAITGIRILNDLKTPNSDGIDLDRCRNVRIIGCHIEAGDDCIVLKTMRGYEQYGRTENVVVSGCTLVSTSTALCVGCEAAAPIRDIVFDSCVIRRSHRGLAINLSYECDVENVIFSNMVVETRLFDDAWWGRGEPIAVKALPWTERDRVGRIRNVVFRNVIARCENGIYVEGEAPDRIEGLRFESVHLTMNKWSHWPGGRLDRRPCAGERNGYSDALRPHPTSAFMIQKAREVAIRDCSVRWEGNSPEYYAHALETDDVQDLTIDGLEGTSAFPSRLAARHLRATSVRVIR
ncbi:MAG: glycoside hydrolase family 28 protein [Fimbriimonas sp.]